MIPRWPFVGRSEELELIGTAMADGGTPGLVLAGAAGVGKTRLLWEAVRGADTARYLPRSVVGTIATQGIPFGALSSLLPAEMPSASSVRNLLGYVSQTLLAPAGDRRLVFGVDDAHVLDDTSAGLLHQLVQTGNAFVLASVRTGEPTPEPITALWKDDLVERVEVQALARGELRGVLADVLGSEVETGTLQRLWDASRGNMLFLRELVNAGLDSGALAEVGGVWTWQGDWVMAPRLTELLSQRIGRLSPEEMHALELVAYGAPLDSSILIRLIDPDVLQSIEEKNLLWSSASGDVYLAHPLYGELLRAECPPLRSKRWKAKLADALEDGGTGSDCLRIATWRLDAGVRVNAETLMTAVGQAWSALDTKLCDRLTTEAISAGAGLPAVKMQWRVLYYEGRHVDAERLLAQWMLAPMDEADRADLVIGRAAHLFWGSDQLELGLGVLRDAEQQASNDVIRQEYAGLRSLCHIIAGQAGAARESARAILDGPVLNPHARALATTADFAVGVHLGTLPAEPLAAFAGAREEIRPWDGEFPFLGDILDWLVVKHLWLRGDLVMAYDRAVELVEFSREHRTEDWIQICEVALARAANLRGRPRTGRRTLRESASRYRRFGGPAKRMGMQIFGELAYAEALLGDADAAEAALKDAEVEAMSAYSAFLFHMDLARPWVVALHGDRPAAIETALEYGRACRADGTAPFEVLSLHNVVRLGGARKNKGVVERLGELWAELEGPMPGLAADHAAASVRDDAPALDEVAAGFERIGADLCAAEAYAEAGLAHAAAGRTASARASQTRAALALDRCEGARTPAVEAVQAPSLTPRERDIARLAASGLSNREIAGRLVLSKRTVDNHLHQVYAKLGITGRSELPTHVTPEPPTARK